MKKKLLAALLATAMTVTMFAGCGTPGSKDSKKDDSSASSGKKRITYTLREDLPSMDPQNSNSISCATAEICTYAMLTRNVEGESNQMQLKAGIFQMMDLLIHSTFVMD